MFFFFFKQKTAYELRISDWSSDVCSSDVMLAPPITVTPPQEGGAAGSRLQVTYIDETLRPPSPAPAPPPRPEPARKRPAPTAPASRVHANPVGQADAATAPQVVDIPATSPEPPAVPEQAPQRHAQD